MKTDVKKSKVSFSMRNVVIVVALLLLSGAVNAQDFSNTKTLLKPDVRITEMWVPEIKMNSVQGTVGTLVGFYGGALVDSKYLLGIAGAVNLTHPTVNYGYFGGIAQVILFPDRMFHLSAQILCAWGTTKDYEDPKEGLLDNFWNISGEDFYISEPGLNLELNLKENLTLIAGASYRFVTRLDPNNENVRITHVTNQDMQGVSFNIGLKFGKKSR
jgi:hypothetical protein